MAIQREQVVQTAEKYVSRGKIEPAIREYRKLLADNPNDINTLNRIGDLYARIQRIDEAVDFFTQIAEQYSTEGFFVKAIAIYKKIIKLDPTRLEVYEKLAELYHKQGLVNEARTQYQVLADYYQKHDNAASAIAIYQKMADLEPNNPSYHVKLAEIYQRQQLTEKAMSEYRVIAEMMLAHDRSQDAAQVYERALDIDSSNVGFIEDALKRLQRSGNTAAAAHFLSLAVERNPQAGRLARLARVDEPAAGSSGSMEAVEARAEPEPPRRVPPKPEPPPPLPPQPPPRPVVRAPEPRFVPPPPPPPSVMEPLGEEPQIYTPAFPEIEVEEDDLTATMQAAAAAIVPGPAEDDAAAAATHGDEIELDLDEVFVLDMESDDEPTSLVKPPPDMAAGTGLRLGSAWAEEVAAAPVQEEPPAVEEELEALSAVPAFPAFPDVEIELELEPPPKTPEAPETAPPTPSPAEPLSSFDSVELPSLEGSGQLLFELEEELPPLEGPTWTVEPEPRHEEPETLRIDHDLLERTAAELQRPVERDEDLVSEAEVLAKYGLEEKALERLRDALRIRPQNLGAHALMVQIHLEKGHHERVVELANTMSRIAAETGDGYLWPKSRRHLVDAGYRLDGDRVLSGPHGMVERVEEPPPAPRPAPPKAAAAPVPEPPAPAPAPPPAPVPSAPAPALPPAARKKPGSDIDQMLQGLLGQPPRARPAVVPPAPVKPAPAKPAAPAPAPPPVVAAPAPPTVASAPPPPAPLPVPQAPLPAPPRPGLFNPLEIGEMIEREEMDWGEPEPAGPSPFQVPLQTPSSAPATPGASARDGLYPGLDDTGGMSWLDEADQGRAPKGSRAERLFDEEEDFFDLAGELEQELSQEDVFQGGDGLLGQQNEQSLEEIVEGFKKGVAEHLSPTDYETHFNLGIAYREMGLLDEAIGEFQIAAKEPTHLVLCCSMLGLCFLDKGLPELAIRWYRRGLDAPGVNEEDTLGLLYDLGCAHLAVGDKETAYKVFVDLYGMDTNYRDVVARIEELGPR
ncbi:MAG TPA: tetratricopeptide repeat protein [Thermoanaerobaculia bacterium]|jgi:tetratricopeptide (TPR) repeat protein|nr:tetratricopeptide repeat protein [Thermoanaerobaculia bacterium]